MSLVFFLLAAAAAAQTDLPPTTPRERVALAAEILRRGDWNERIHAAYGLGEFGAEGLPGLRVAAEDADWQVRMTAVHLMGRVGAAAVPDLARVVKNEPCRHVLLTALNWLGAIGTPEADAVLRGGLTREGAVRLAGNYCWSSSNPGRADWAENRDAAARAAKGAPRPEIDEPVVTRDPTPRPAPAAAPAPAAVRAEKRLPPRERERLKELDALLAPEAGAPEPPPRVAALSPDERVVPSGDIRAPAPRGAPETMPPGAPGLSERPAPATSGPAIMPDAGTGKAENDPLPELKRLLADRDPRKRARAADEIGQRGAAAASAEPALAAALKDADRRVRASAALALGNLGAAADPAVPALIAALKRGPEEVEASAAIALGRISTPRARRAFARYARKSAGDFLKRSGR